MHKEREEELKNAKQKPIFAVAAALEPTRTTFMTATEVVHESSVLSEEMDDSSVDAFDEEEQELSSPSIGTVTVMGSEG